MDTVVWNHVESFRLTFFVIAFVCFDTDVFLAIVFVEKLIAGCSRARDSGAMAFKLG